MTRSPFYSPLARAADMEGGGAADLQTDIMRFMAILALCLVAIFALVQSIPLQPTSSARPAPIAPSPQVEMPGPIPENLRRQALPQQPKALVQRDTLAQGETRAERETFVEIRSDLLSERGPATGSRAVKQATAEMQSARVSEATPAPETSSTREAESASASRRPPQTTAAATGTPSSRPASPSPATEGFTLRFDSDTALTRLVARNEVSLYAIGAERALRMSASRGSVSFWPASAPSQFHEMEPATVPAEVVAALRRSGAMALDEDVQWGVTLPPRMRRQLDRYLAEHTAGALVIEGDGKLRLEP